MYAAIPRSHADLPIFIQGVIEKAGSNKLYLEQYTKKLVMVHGDTMSFFEKQGKSEAGSFRMCPKTQVWRFTDPGAPAVVAKLSNKKAFGFCVQSNNATGINAADAKKLWKFNTASQEELDAWILGLQNAIEYACVKLESKSIAAHPSGHGQYAVGNNAHKNAVADAVRREHLNSNGVTVTRTSGIMSARGAPGAKAGAGMQQMRASAQYEQAEMAHLDRVDQYLDGLHEKALTIGSEADKQKVYVQQMRTGIDNATSEMNKQNTKMNKQLGKAKGKKDDGSRSSGGGPLTDIPGLGGGTMYSNVQKQAAKAAMRGLM